MLEYLKMYFRLLSCYQVIIVFHFMYILKTGDSSIKFLANVTGGDKSSYHSCLHVDYIDIHTPCPCVFLA